jgi:hypothetical protein
MAGKRPEQGHSSRSNRRGDRLPASRKTYKERRSAALAEWRMVIA